MEKLDKQTYFDAVIIGGGIAGMQSSLDLADQGFKVLILEKSPSIGGKMISLSKVFPTLDCTSCITTPKMAACAHHPNITIMADSDVKAVHKSGNGFIIDIVKKPRFINEKDCTACRKCEYACPVELPHWFESNMGVRRTIYVPFENAIPQVAIRDRDNCLGRAPCQNACPAGVDAKGYISLIAQGRFDEALDVVRKTIPFAGVCGRVCAHPCEQSCARGSVEEPTAIRSLKRFLADYALKAGKTAAPGRIQATYSEKVAVIGSGPSGLACAYDLVRWGYPVTVFESSPKAGGLMRYGIPEYRLPRDILDNEISFIEQLGVEIKTSTPVKELGGLFNQGYKAVYVAVGCPESVRLRVPGSDAAGILNALDFLKDVNAGEKVSLGRRLVVIGGGSVAVDAARVSLRLGVKEVHLVCLESRDLTCTDHMLAQEREIIEAEEEGLLIHSCLGIKEIITQSGVVTGLATIPCLSVRDKDGRFAPRLADSPVDIIPADNIIVAVGQSPSASMLTELKRSPVRTIDAQSITLETNIEGVFAGGDVVSGPSDVIQAVKIGKEAAISIHRYLQGKNLKTARRRAEEPVQLQPDQGLEKKKRTAIPVLPPDERIKSFTEVELGFDEESAREEAGRCLSCLCGNCERVCPTDAVNFSQQPEDMVINSGSVIFATGFELTPLDGKKEYGVGQVPNVLSPLQMERLLVPNGPYGRVLRPSDGKVPDSIAYVQCAGSRDKSQGVSYCSRVCCMYAIKQAMLLSGSLPMADITIYYMDIRAFGKGYEEFFQNAKAMGIHFVKGKVARITAGNNQSPVVRVENIEEGGTVIEQQHDMVVLSLGMKPSWQPDGNFPVSMGTDGFISCPGIPVAPVLTGCEGIFVAGTASGPKDIVDSILEGGTAAMEASNYLKRNICGTVKSAV